MGATPSAEPGVDLKPDCGSCCGLCCVAPAFAVSSDFAINKPAGKPCPRLTGDFRCSIHARLRPEGFQGCIAYDCFGAGQKVTQITFKGRDWRGSPNIANQMFDVFGVMQQIHSMLNYLTQALVLEPARSMFDELSAKFEELRLLSEGPADDLQHLDLSGHRREVDRLLLAVSKLVRS